MIGCADESQVCEHLIGRLKESLRPAAIEAEIAELVPIASSGPVKQIHGAAAVLAGSVLFDSAMDYYRDSFQNKAMFARLAASSLNLAASLRGMNKTRTDSHSARTLSYSFAIGVGALGFGFYA